MFDWDVVIIGSGPAALAAGIYLGQANYRTILIEKEDHFGGYIVNLELIENYPGFSDGISGARLSSEMIKQATKWGAKLKQGEVVGIDLFSACRYVKCAEGTGYTCAAVIVAGGARRKKLGVPGEKDLFGKGVFTCAFCDGSQFKDRVVVVCGGGNAGVTEALYMTKLASKVILIEAEPRCTATPMLLDRASANPKLEIRCGLRVESILGDRQVEAIALRELSTNQREEIKTDGILVHIGNEANTEYLEGMVTLDSQGRILVNAKLETETPYILAAGDIRSGSPMQIVSAVGDGAIAAISAQAILQQMK